MVSELVPFIRHDCRSPEIRIATAGTSLGAFYAANFALKHPEIFHYALCMSGRYDITGFTGGFTNTDIYFNNPMAYAATSTASTSSGSGRTPTSPWSAARGSGRTATSRRPTPSPTSSPPRASPTSATSGATTSATSGRGGGGRRSSTWAGRSVAD